MVRTVGIAIQIDATPLKIEMAKVKDEQEAIRQNQGKIYSESVYLYTQMAQLAGMWLNQFKDIAAVQALQEALQLGQMVLYQRRLAYEISGLIVQQRYVAASVLSGIAVSYAALYLKTKQEQIRRKELDNYMKRVNAEIRSWS